MTQSNYLMTDGLAQAVEMARVLSMPLLITGEPGVGKSTLASALAKEHGASFFEIKIHSDTRYRDLFYNFDDVGRFSEASLQHQRASASQDYLPAPDGIANTDPRLFIRFVGLGAAILQGMDRDQPWLAPAIREGDYMAGRASSVVLIDEIDKAPRDVPNDLLVQLDQWRFEVPEFARLRHYPRDGFVLDEDAPRPLVIITSNLEKTLPEAFMRRCVYYHIELPPSRDQDASATVTLDDIVVQKVQALIGNDSQAEGIIKESIAAFGEVRELAQNRKPGLAELLNWVHYLLRVGGSPQSIDRLSRADVMQMLNSLLLKDPADHQALQQRLDSTRYPTLTRWLERDPPMHGTSR